MLFEEQISRKPDLYPWTQDFINTMWDGHWTPNEFSFQGDLQHFQTELTNEEQVIIKNTLSAIGQIEIAVKKFWSRLGDNLPHPSVTDMGLVMAHIEVIHNQAYEKLLNVLQLHDVFEQNLKLDIIKGRVNYLKKYLEKNYTDSKKQYVYSLILFTLFVENVSLFSQFYIILWFNKKRGLLKDTAQQVQYTKNEEMIHAQVGVKLINTIRQEYPEIFDHLLIEKIRHEAEEAYKAEAKIVDWMLGSYNAPALNKDILKEYIKNRINDSLKQIDIEEIFSIDESLLDQTQWMEVAVLGSAKTDFFHKRPTEYSKNQEDYSADDLFSN